MHIYICACVSMSPDAWVEPGSCHLLYTTGCSDLGSPLETGPARSQDRYRISEACRANTRMVREQIPNSSHTWEVGEGR